MIPVGMYNAKLSQLSGVLDSMGSTPAEVAEWVANDRNRGNVELAFLTRSGAQSVSLVDTLPQFETQSILGLKLTEPAYARKAQRLLDHDHATLYQEINQIEGIRSMLERQWDRIKYRLSSMRYVKDEFGDKARTGGPEAEQAWGVVEDIERLILPTLEKLQNELYRAVRQCDREIRDRADKIETIDRKQLSIPKYNRRARRKRKARAAAKAAAEAAGGGDSGDANKGK